MDLRAVGSCRQEAAKERQRLHHRKLVGKHCLLQRNTDLLTDSIRIIPEEFTAGAYITTDMGDNQITGFNPGSMKHPSEFDLATVNAAECMAIVAPGNLQDMAEYALGYQQRGVFCIFDPGQSLPAWNSDDLASTIGRANMLVSNDYELEMITNSTGLSVDQILDVVDTIITTKAEHGCEVLTRNAVAAIPAIPTPPMPTPPRSSG